MIYKFKKMLFNVGYHTQIAFTTLRLNNKDFNLAMDGAHISLRNDGK